MLLISFQSNVFEKSLTNAAKIPKNSPTKSAAAKTNFLFNDGFDKIKIEQKRFFRLFLGQPGHSIFATPDLRKKHMKLPISIKEAKYWLEDFELALDRIDIDPAIKKFFSQKINALTMQMINTI